MQCGRDIPQRIQNEVACRYPGVRQRKFGGLQLRVAVDQHIEVDLPRSPANPSRLAAEFQFQIAQRTQQIERREPGQDSGNSVDEGALSDRPERRAAIARRNGDYTRDGKCRNRCDRAGDAATRIAQIAAKPDVGWLPGFSRSRNRHRLVRVRRVRDPAVVRRPVVRRRNPRRQRPRHRYHPRPWHYRLMSDRAPRPWLPADRD